MRNIDLDNLLKEERSEYLITNVISKDEFIYLLINDKTKLKVSYDDYLKFALRKDKYIDSDTYNVLLHNQKYLDAYNNALTKLSNREYSIYKLKMSLLSKYDLPEDELNKIIDKLKSINLLNDENYVESKLLYFKDKTYSKKQIYSKLMKDGINIELINKHYQEEDEYEKALLKANKYKKSLKNKSIAYLKLTIQNKLLNDGYKMNDIKKAIANLDFSSDKESEFDSCLKQAYKLYNKYGSRYSNYELNNKIYTNLLTKGFKSEDINNSLIEMGLK